MSCTILVENIHGEIIAVDSEKPEKSQTVVEFSRRLDHTGPCEDYRPASITRDLQTLHSNGVRLTELLSRGDLTGLFPPEDEHTGLTRNGSNDEPRPLLQQLDTE